MSVTPKKRIAQAPLAARKLAIAPSRAKRMAMFVERYIYVPEGALVGKPMVLLPEQKHFIDDVYDNVDPNGRLITRRGIFSIARKNGKTGLVSALLGGHIIGPEARENADVYSAARSRDQAGIVFKYLAKSLRMNPHLEGLVQITDSSKKIVGLRTNSTYKALSAEATTAHGLSPALTIHDELGQVVGPNDALYDALETAGGAQAEPLSLIISTQAANDADLLSQIIDDALRNPEDRRTICHLYAATKSDDVFDPAVWHRVNFALGIFRSEEEFLEAAQRAKRMPSFEATFRNLYLNMRIALQQLFIAPSVWKENNKPVDEDLFYSEPVHVALDLSSRVDLTAAVLSVVHPETGVVHLKPFVYTPADGLQERALRDRAPYQLWVERGEMFTTAGRIVDYDQVAEHLAGATTGMNIASVSFDRWRIDLMKKAAIDAGWAHPDEVPWLPIGQGFRDMSPRMETFEAVLLNHNIAHGDHPLLNLGAGNAIAVRDPAGNRKLDKSKASARIDPLVAAVMAVHAAIAPADVENAEVTEADFLIA